MTLLDYLPETQLLNYYCEGIPRHTNISPEDTKKIFDGIREKCMRIYFPIFWNHNEVSQLKRHNCSDIETDKLIAVTNKLSDLILSRDEDCVHWIERINIFHLFGLIRIYGSVIRDKSVQFLRSICSDMVKDSNAFFMVSAINAKSVLEFRDPKDERDFFDLSEKYPFIIRDFGNYQVFYYGGLQACIDELSQDLYKQNKVPIPSSVLSLLYICDLHFPNDVNIKTRIYDELYSLLPSKSKMTIDKFYNRLKQF